MELLSGNLQIVEIGKINKKKIRRYVAPDLKMPVYIHTFVFHSMFLIQKKYSFEI